MRFSVFHLMELPRGQAYEQAEAEIAEQVQYAEELGFARVWLAEHHFDRDYGLCPSTLLYAAKLGQLTSRIRLGSLVVVLPLNHPLRVAEEAAFADVLVGGRLDLGLGAGYAPYEFAGYGVDLDSRRERFREGVEILTQALSGQRFAYRGSFYQFSELESFPQPLQRPLPLWLTANSANTAAWVGQQGKPCVLSGSSLPLETLRECFGGYRQVFEAAGHPGPAYCMMNRQVYVAESDAQARLDAEGPTMDYILRQQRVFRAGQGIDEAVVSYDRLVGNMFTHGSPETCAANIEMLRQELGLGELSCKFRSTGLSHRQVMASMRRFAEEVIPRFQPAVVEA